MSKVIIPKNYHAALGPYDTQKAIGMIHILFEEKLCDTLNLKRVSAPLFLEASTGLNDDLNGVERPVTFDIKDINAEAQVVHSLAKWKRQALHDYDFHIGKGIYTDMNAIRRDEELDNLHSVYVDQWDWEKVIDIKDRTIEYLKETATGIITAICDTEDILRAIFPQLDGVSKKDRNISFITTQELEDLYPDKTPKEREDAYTKEHPTTFLMQIGGALKSGERQDGRAPDYDDWEMNGDILFYNSVLGSTIEISSMGIRVSPESLDRQLKLANCECRREFPFHKALLNGELPYTIGGGIGQSRLCMLLLGAAHIGEVQSTIWDQKTKSACKEAGIFIL
jgi:aspartate--ammonia ligase